MKLLVLIFILHFTGLALAQEVDFNQAVPDTTGYYIKLPYEEVNGKLIVKVEVGGKQRRFIFDTGAITCISQELADKLMLTPVEKVSAVDQSDKRDSVFVVILDRIAFDSIAFNNVPALSFQQSAFFTCFKVDGFIGSNLLHNSIVQFAPDTTIIITDRPDSLELNKKYSTKLYLNNAQSSPYINIKFGNSKLQFLFDSGSDELIAVNHDNYGKLQKWSGFRELSKAYGNSSVGMFGVAENAGMRRAYLSRLTLGKSKLANAIIHTTEGHSRIGSKILSYGIVTIDYISKLFYFEPNNSGRLYTNVRERYWTVSPSIEDGVLIVGAVWDDLGQNINQGDRILAIDGVSYRQRSECEMLLKPLIDAGKNEALLTIENKDGVRRNVKIIKQ